MGWQLIGQLVFAVLLLVMSGLAASCMKEARSDQERRHWSITSSVYLIGTVLAVIIILGGLR